MSTFDLSELAKMHTSTLAASKPPEDNIFLRLNDKDLTVSLRILPGVNGDKPYHVCQAHKVNNKFLVCPRVQTIINGRSQWVAPPEGGDCPICLYYKQKYKLYNPGKPPAQLEEALRAIKPMVRCSWNVVVRDYGGKKNVVRVWSCGIQLAQKIWSTILGDVATGRKAKGDVCHPSTGRDFLLVKKSKGGSGYPDYSESEFLDSSAAGTPEEFKAWLSQAHDLAAINKPATQESLVYNFKVHNGVLKEEDSDATSEFEIGGDGDSNVVESKSSIPVQTPKAKEAKATPELDDMDMDPEFLKELDDAHDDLQGKKKSK